MGGTAVVVFALELTRQRHGLSDREEPVDIKTDQAPKCVLYRPKYSTYAPHYHAAIRTDIP